MIKKLGYYLFAMCFTVFRIIPLNRNKIFFVATHDDSSEGNIGIVAEAVRREMPEKKCIFLTKRDGIRRPFSFFLGKAFHMATSAVIFLDNEFMPMAYTRISPRAKVVQLWHGTGTIKKFGLDSDTGEVARLARKANGRLTHLIVNSELTKKQYGSAFGVPEDKIYMLGLPRTDLMLDEKRMDKLKKNFYEQYPLLVKKHCSLYAPTFRDSEVDKPVFGLDFDSFCSCMEEDEVLLVRLHPHVAAKCPDSIWERYAGTIVNVSEYPGVATLLAVAERLITDYSSIIFEYCLLDREMIFYAYDYEDFRKEGRDFYEEYPDFVPGPVVYSQQELEKIWQEKSFDSQLLQRFKKKTFCYLDQNATNRLLELIFGKK